VAMLRTTADHECPDVGETEKRGPCRHQDHFSGVQRSATGKLAPQPRLQMNCPVHYVQIIDFLEMRVASNQNHFV
jgi:hypothetical protein